MTAFDETYLMGVRVLEVADEHGEFAGKLLAGLGADVVKVEPLTGEPTRQYGPFLDDRPDPDRSLYFWHYNHGKRGVCLDLDSDQGQQSFRQLAESADVIIDARPSARLAEVGLGYQDLRALNPRLVFAEVTPFGEHGPWADHAASDLVHIALGGMMMNTGYDPDPTGFYDTPPMAPQMWHAYHVAGEMTAMSILAALHYRMSSGEGQRLHTSVHHAAAANTESDVPAWAALRIPYVRQSGRHAMPALTIRALALTKDGRYILPYTTYVKNFPDSWAVDIRKLREFGMQADLDDPQWDDSGYRAAHQDHIADIMDRAIRRTTYDSGLWQEMLEAGLTWAPVRRPEENLEDPHWWSRGTFVEVDHPELERRLTYVGARWVSDQARWSLTRRAPLLGEHTDEVLQEWSVPRPAPQSEASAAPSHSIQPRLSQHGKPFALTGVRVVDLSWMLASAGAGRFLASMGAEVIKVEHISRLDGMRAAGINYPAGGRSERDAATGPLPQPSAISIDRSANFNEINAGKLALSLNLRDPRGKEILAELIATADVVLEGYSPGTMDRMGFGYEKLKEINPQVIYVQQSGLGQRGNYGAAKAFGPTAQGFSGLTDMSGFPAPWPPAGIGYSYLDWFGAYNMATATLAALYRRGISGEGCHIDASQAETGVYLCGTAILDFTANGRSWERQGNRSPWKPAAPNGVYRASGVDRWVAISCFTDSQWDDLLSVLGSPAWAASEKFSTLESRLSHQDELDQLMTEETRQWDRYELMRALQDKGVPAGVAQDAQDRFETDPQLQALDWQVELEHTTAGRWPAKEHPVTFSETPAYVGGAVDRHGPVYGEDTDDVLSRILELTPDQIETLRETGVV